MSATKVLVTGGAGYIGSHTVMELLAQGFEVMVLDNLCTSERQNIAALDVDLIVGNVSDEQLLGRILEYNAIDAIVHLAGHSPLAYPRPYPEALYETQVVNTFVLLKLMHQKGIKHLVLASSMEVYGTPQYEPVDENHPVNPNNSFGRACAIQELLVQDLAKSYGIQYAILRYTNVFGCSDALAQAKFEALNETFLASEAKTLQKLSLECDETRPSKVSMHEQIFVDGVSVTDVAKANVMALEHLFVSKKPLIANINAGIPIDLTAMAKAMYQAGGQPFSGFLTDPEKMLYFKALSTSTWAEECIGWKAADLEYLRWAKCFVSE